MSIAPTSHTDAASSDPGEKRSKLPYYACVPDDLAQIFQESTRKGTYALTPAESWWSAREPFLSSSGYTLRPRYRANWKPSWLGTNRNPEFCEDSVIIDDYHVMDATRRSDGLVVSIKIIKNDTDELSIARYLSSSVPRTTQNHCIPVFQVLPDPFESTKKLMVMPYLRPFDDPPFTAIGEVFDFINQTLEGILFMHHHKVAHRDCAAANIMMDGRPLYPQGHHPVRREFSKDAVYELTPLSRLDHRIRYYFIDFGISSFFPSGTPPLAVGRQGRDKEVPELSDDVPYNAYKVDIFILGNLYRINFVEKYHGLKSLEPLVDGMTRRRPDERLTADEALKFFQDIRSRIDGTQWRSRLRARDESFSERVINNATYIARESVKNLVK